MLWPWLKAFHIIFVVCWFAGIFYLPRLFVYHAQSDDAAVRAQLAVMERRLFLFVTPFAVISIALGVWMMVAYWPAYRGAGWLHAKIALVLLLVAHHVACGYYVKRFQRDLPTPGHVFFRWFNEMPVLLLFAIVILAVVKPF